MKREVSGAILSCDLCGESFELLVGGGPWVFQNAAALAAEAYDWIVLRDGDIAFCGESPCAVTDVCQSCGDTKLLSAGNCAACWTEALGSEPSAKSRAWHAMEEFDLDASVRSGMPILKGEE